ncbi:MAG: hypothetical protein ABIX01_16405 [Chitinophagaceae bacterium]
MKKITNSVRLIVIGGLLTFTACKKHTDSNNDITGYLYTTTNGESTNSVVRFTRHNDGSITDEKAYTTNSLGGANVAAGGDAHGDFDSQGGVQIIGNYLLNVNAGGNQISVFGLDRTNGDLSFKNNVASGGTRPVSIAYTKKSGSTDEYWVVVGNQWNNPNVQKDGAAIQRYPNNAFYLQNLALPDATDDQRNIQIFTFNSATGILTSVAQLDKYVRENGGPSCVAFSADGTKLAVGTWGIAHFDTQVTSLAEQHPSRVYVYNFTNGAVSGKRYFEEAGISGTIGFTWDKSSNSKLYVSNFNLIPAKQNNSVTMLTDNGSVVTKTGNSGTTPATAINEACWATLNPIGDKLYVASFQTNLVSTFSVATSGISYASNETRKDLAPHGDSKELWVSPDNRFLYNTGALQSFSINRFDVSGNNIVYQKQTILATTADGKGIVGKYNFLGLMGFDIVR